MKLKVGIIGFGNIGQEFYQKVVSTGWEVAFVADDKHIFVGDLKKPRDVISNWKKYCRNLDAVGLAVPSDNGLAALQYITWLIGKKIFVATCEKSALANYFNVLKPLLPMIGYSATVGGGSGMLHFLQNRFFSGTQEVYVILNGTLSIYKGMSFQADF